MTQEIIDAVRDIEREKGIEGGTLVAALEDALLAAYKKTPGASRHATVEIDDQGDFRVYSIELPPDIEERLLDEARERALEELERIEAENGERSHTLLSDNDLDIDWSGVPDEQVKREDVTPENFGRIAAQTAKQVILQRIREAERGSSASTLPRSTSTLLRSPACWTMPVTTSLTRSTYSSYIIARSASRIRCRITCFAVCAAMRPKFSGVTSSRLT